MSISSTRRISSATSTTSKVEPRAFIADNHSQFVENIDTTNNVLVRDETNADSGQQKQPSARQTPQPNFNSASPNISTSIEALALSGVFDETASAESPAPDRVSVYSNNQTIIKDEDVERTGRHYLKHFYEKNEHLEDIDELI